MPNNVVDTPREERLWDKAKARAKEEGRTEDWAYIMGIYKKMNPDRFKSAMTDDLLRIASQHPTHARTIASIMMEAGGWVPGELRDPRTWAPGHVDQSPPVYKDVGSQVPPARDNYGHQLDEDGNPVDSVPRVAAAWADLAARVQKGRSTT